MATQSEITKLLTDAALAFPAYDRAKLTPALKFYVKALAQFPAAILEAALEQVITTSKWFPAVAEIAEVCRRVEAESRPNQIAVMRGDVLRERAFDLERNRASGYFVPDQWEELAQYFEKAGRVEAANHLRMKAGLAFVFEPYGVKE